LFSGAQYYGEGPSHTPAMLEVLKLRQLRTLNSCDAPAGHKQLHTKGGEEEEPEPATAALLPTRVLPSRSPIPLDVVLSRPGSPSTDKLRMRRQPSNKELVRLQPFLPEPEPKRRTRSAGKAL
jgi:hypothetical protein